MSYFKFLILFLIYPLCICNNFHKIRRNKSINYIEKNFNNSILKHKSDSYIELRKNHNSSAYLLSSY